MVLMALAVKFYECLSNLLLLRLSHPSSGKGGMDYFSLKEVKGDKRYVEFPQMGSRWEKDVPVLQRGETMVRGERGNMSPLEKKTQYSRYYAVLCFV